MAENELTSISISAKADVGNATKSLNKLSKALEKLKSLSQTGVSTETTRSLEAMSTAISNLSGVTFPTKLSGNLTKFADSLATLNSGVKGFDLGKLKEINLVVQSLAAAGMGNALPGFENTAVTPREVTAPTGNTANDTERLTEANNELIESLEELSGKFSKIGSEMEKTGRSIKDAEKRVKSLGKVSTTSSSKLGQLWAAMKRIATYRLLRSAIRAITQAFREGIQNLYQFSTLIDGTFKQSMDSLATSALYLKNSLGAMVAPIINALAPAIDFLVDKFVDLLNIINQLFARITGASTWTKALKYPKQYGEDLKKAGGAAKELKATLLGFDEINRLDDLTNRGGGGGASNLDYSEMFEEVELTKKSWMEMFEDLLDSGKNKFSVWAAGLSGILSLKLAGGLTGVFGGAAGSSGILSGFTATMLAAFAGFSLGNWMYQNNVGGVRDIADDLMEHGLGEAITNVLERLKKGWNDYTEAAIELGDALWKKWDDLENKAIKWGDTLWDAWESTKDYWDTLWDNEEYVVLTPVVTPFANDIINALADAGLVFNNGKWELGVDVKVGETQTPTPVSYPLVGGKSYTPGTGVTTEKADVLSTIEGAMDNVKKTVLASVDTTYQQYSYVPSYITKKAAGGDVNTGELFIANEKGPELIAQLGQRTQVANSNQITESIRIATAQGNSEGNGLLRQAVALLGGILAKENVVEAVVTTDSITNGLRRQNLRDGRATVEVG